MKPGGARMRGPSEVVGRTAEGGEEVSEGRELGRPSGMRRAVKGDESRRLCEGTDGPGSGGLEEAESPP